MQCERVTAARGTLREQLATRVEMHRRHQRGYLSGLVYVCLEELVLRHGEFFEARSLGENYPYRTPKQCFRNAYDLASRESADKLVYVEGYALMDVVPLATEHAWCVDEENRVVDPTWRTPGASYLGVALPISVVRAAVLARGRYGAFGDHRDLRAVLGAPLDIDALITAAAERPAADPFAAQVH